MVLLKYFFKLRFVLIVLNFSLMNSCAPVLVGSIASSGAISAAQERSMKDAAIDLKIKATINEALFKENFDEIFTPIKILVIEGRVLLVGTVNSLEIREKAAEISWKTSGVKEVLNYVLVGSQGTVIDYATDTRISSELRARYLFDDKINEINYDITTENKNIYLFGISKTQEELDYAVNIAKTIPGANKVVVHLITASDPKRLK